MYERFYNLRQRPFSLSPDPDYLYPSRVHKEALGYLRYGIEGRAGFVVITGEIGCGKTTLLQTVLRGLDRHTSVSRIVNTMLDARELVEAVMLDFGLDPGVGRSKPHLLHDLARYLVAQRTAGRLTLLVIDEAQNLSPPALEEVRMLSNLETEKSKLIQIVLVGQPSLRDVLARPELEQLRQRITVSYHLLALDAAETAAYVNHRLRRAAIGAPLEFSRDITDLIHRHSRGVPRMINVIADAMLLFGYGEERRVIDVDLAANAIDELIATGVLGGAPPSGTVRAAAAPDPRRTGNETAAGPDGLAEQRAATRRDDLAERERRLAERERELAEALRSLPTGGVAHAAAPPRPPVARPTAALPPSPPLPPPIPAPAVRAAIPLPAGVSRPAPAYAQARPSAPPRPPVRTVPPETFWIRLRRQFVGAFKPVFED
jgi:putative secretion ATPase (PEP-CTERM system associated)